MSNEQDKISNVQELIDDLEQSVDPAQYRGTTLSAYLNLISAIEERLDYYYTDVHDIEENEFEFPSTEKIVDWMLGDEGINEALEKLLQRQVETRRQEHDHMLEDTMADWDEPQATHESLNKQHKLADIAGMKRRRAV